jgi:N-acetylglucosaminyldiphosphoundecaprenol N-acetyl-beta-D-mannosaminyltransferase
MCRALKSVFGLRFSTCGLASLADALTNSPPPAGGEAQMLFTVNLDNVVCLRSNAAFRAAHRRAKIVTIDGAPVYLYARLRGAAVPGRITGADLLPALVERFTPGRQRPFFVTSDQTTARAIEAFLVQRGLPKDDLGFAVPPLGFETDEVYSMQLARQIRDHRTSHLIFGVGAPKSQIWLDQYRGEVGSCYAFPFGSAPNFMVGTASRAPRWVRAMGCEWFWRFCCEPRRLFRRYFIDSWQFVAAIREDMRALRNGVTWDVWLEQSKPGDWPTGRKAG